MMKKILIIDDEDLLREEITGILMYEGFYVVEARNGNEGVKKAKEIIPDLILCDILMPDMDGFQVLQNLKETKHAESTPFIFITAIGDRKNYRKGMEMGAEDFLIKPFTRTEILNAIKIRLQKASRQIEQLHAIYKKIIYTIPHELRTPLNAVIGFGEILQDSGADLKADDVREIGKSILESGNRLFQIVQKYLMYIEIESQDSLSDINNSDIFAEHIKELAIQTATKYKRLQDLVLRSESIRFKAKATWLIFALNELIDNAFKFSRPGNQVKITIKQKTCYLLIVIQDKGRGFPRGSLEQIHVFEQFDRKIYEQQGIGFGLFLSKKIAEKHSGTIQIKTSEGKGSAVILKLPIE